MEGWRARPVVVAAAVVGMLAAGAGCSGPDGGAPVVASQGATAATEPGPSPAPSVWRSVAVTGLPPGFVFDDVAVDRAGTFVAVGRVAAPGEETMFGVFRSLDGSTWEDVHRQRVEWLDGLAVASHEDGFVVVGGDCDDACRPFALHSPDGRRWRGGEVLVPPPGPDPPEGQTAQPSGSSAGRNRTMLARPTSTVRATPDFYSDGAAFVDVVAGRHGLVAGGWVESPTRAYTARTTFWASTDDGRTWRPAAVDPRVDDPRSEYVAQVVRRGEGYVALARNPGTYSGTPQALWSSEDGRAWARIPLDFEDELWGTSLAAVGPTTFLTGDAQPCADGALWASEDLRRWRRAGDGLTELGYTTDGVHAGPEGLLLLGRVEERPADCVGGAVASWGSSDGARWLRRPFPERVDQGVAVAADGRWFVFAEGPRLWTAPAECTRGPCPEEG